MEKTVIPKGTVIKNKDGAPAWEFISDLREGDPFFCTYVVSLPDRKHPMSGSQIAPEIIKYMDALGL